MLVGEMEFELAILIRTKSLGLYLLLNDLIVFIKVLQVKVLRLIPVEMFMQPRVLIP